jgi:3-isopropylmalate/(R)-2-methylmalate dehydratase small subunit
MDVFTRLRAVAAPLMQENINTDAIISAQSMVGGMVARPGDVLFTAWRYRPDGGENPDFVLNTARYRAARILVAARNFGCGSSREHAVWALTGYGIRCVIAPSFGEIFYDNAFQNGLLPAVVGDAVAQHIADTLDRAERPEIEVDLEGCRLELPDGEAIAFEVPGERREALLRGLDDLAFLRARLPGAEVWARQARPWMLSGRRAAR